MNLLSKKQQIMSSSRYDVILGDYARRHYFSKFKKKYKRAWEITYRSLEQTLERIDKMPVSKGLTVIAVNKGYTLYKYEFKIAGSSLSARTSGNRCVLMRDDINSTVTILLVYSKGDVKGNQETVWWQQAIKENYHMIPTVFPAL